MRRDCECVSDGCSRNCKLDYVVLIMAIERT